ncbi:DUF4142 domain-containing protein [Paracraurococcus ruber]|nr:DUF4142 domain-containing protein [Paracraurococcus ruber]
MNRRLALLAGTAVLAAAPALAQTQQQRAQAAQGQAGGPAATTAPASTGARAEVVTAEEFIRLSTMSDRFEIASSRIAGEKSQNAQVKEFAQQMIRDHEKTSQDRQKVAQVIPGSGAGAGTPLPNGREAQGSRGSAPITNTQSGPQAEGLDQQHAAMLQQLQQASGPALDRLYIQMQVQSHRQAVDLVRNYGQQGDNPQLKQFANQILPDLEKHLEMAQRIQQSLPS